jgi:glycosyltransferase involved in cell wall biosynthesis
MNPLVSVIVPFYNAEKFLAEAIESVLEQNYAKWELLLIDDGSRDSSTNIATEYAKKNHNRIQYIEHPSHQNRGACASRNAGISMAKGEYIAFLDSDDVWLPDKLQQQLNIFEQVPEATVVCGPAFYWFSWTNQRRDEKLDVLQDLGVEAEKLYRAPSLLLRMDPLGKGSSVCPSNILIRRDALERTGGFEEEFTGIYQAYEDQAFGLKIFLKESVFVSGNSWLKYRKHPESSTSVVNHSGKDREAHLFLLRWVQDFLDRNAPGNLDALYALRRAYWPYEHPVLNRIKEGFLAPLGWTKWVALKILGPQAYRHLRRKFGT